MSIYTKLEINYSLSYKTDLVNHLMLNKPRWALLKFNLHNITKILIFIN